MRTGEEEAGELHAGTLPLTLLNASDHQLLAGSRLAFERTGAGDLLRDHADLNDSGAYGCSDIGSDADSNAVVAEDVADLDVHETGLLCFCGTRECEADRQ